MKILNLVKADFMKMRRTSFFWIHIFMPIIGVLMFLGYYSYSPWSAEGKILGYLEAISIVFPFLIGILCSMVVEQEFMAGRFKEILSAECGKKKMVFSKLILLLLMGIFSLALAIGVFFLGFQYILKQNTFSFVFYMYSTLIIFGTQIFLYLLHLWLSIFYGKGVSISIGIFESLCSALMLTGLGSGIWYFIPCGWAVRFSDYFMGIWTNTLAMVGSMSEVNMGIISSVVFTVIFIIFLGIKINYFEGREEK